MTVDEVSNVVCPRAHESSHAPPPCTQLITAALFLLLHKTFESPSVFFFFPQLFYFIYLFIYKGTFHHGSRQEFILIVAAGPISENPDWVKARFVLHTEAVFFVNMVCDRARLRGERKPCYLSSAGVIGRGRVSLKNTALYLEKVIGLWCALGPGRKLYILLSLTWFYFNLFPLSCV